MNISRVSLFNTTLNFPNFGQKKEIGCSCGFCSGVDADTFSRRSDDPLFIDQQDKGISEIIKKPSDEEFFYKLSKMNQGDLNDIDKNIPDPNMKEIQKRTKEVKKLEVGDWPPPPKEHQIGDVPIPPERKVGDWPPPPKEYQIGDVPIPPERKVGDWPPPPKEYQIGDVPIPDDLKIVCIDSEE